MKYRPLGNTGIEVSELGLGCEAFAECDDTFAKSMFDLAIDKGVNCMDLFSSDPHMRSRIGGALRGRRKGFILQAHICSVWQDGQYKRSRELEEVRAGFADLLERLETDYIDIGMIHYVDSLEDWRRIADGDVMKYVQQLKADGKIKAVGMSSHNPIAALEAVKSGLIEVLMFSVNPCYDLQPGNEDLEKLWADESYEMPLLNMDPDRAALYEACQRMGVGITGHEGLRRGRPARR